MTSPVGDLNTPDLPSEHEEIDNGNCRLEKDSSNEDMFEDSSGDEFQPASESDEDVQQESSNDVPTVSEKPKPAAKDETVCESVSLYEDGEESLMVMTEEEREYFERYKDANQAQLASLKCTICSCQLFIVNPDTIRIHPALGVLVCKNCREFYSNGPFTKDEDGHDEYCRWCAEGGMMICCDTCSNVFCKACLRRCVGRLALLEITNSKCNWSCLVCNNLPLWSQRALSRMVLITMRSHSSRKSLSRSLFNSPSMKDTKDPAVWLPAIINEAEKLATYCKVLATKVGNNWNKDGASVNGDQPRTYSRQEKDLNKFKVIECCRKLRKAVVTTQLNMQLLEKKLVQKYEQRYGNASEIEVESRPEASTSAQDSAPRTGKRLIVKIKSFREDNRKQDYYAEIRNSPSASPTEKALPPQSPQHSVGSVSSLATIPLSEKGTPSRKESKADDDTLPLLTKLNDENEAQTGIEHDIDAHVDRFFDACSELPDENVANSDEPSPVDDAVMDPLSVQTPSSNSSATRPNKLKKRVVGEVTVSPQTPSPVLRTYKRSSTKSNQPHSDVKHHEDLKPQSDVKHHEDLTCDNTLLTPSTQKSGVLNSASDASTPLTKLKDELNDTGDSDKSLAETSPSSNERKNRDVPSETVTDQCNPLTECMNEKARLELLRNSSDSDDSLAEIKLSPRVKKTKKRSRLPFFESDDPKLKAECAVVVSRITLDDELAMEKCKSESEEVKFGKQIDRLLRNPLIVTKRSQSRLSEEDASNQHLPKTKKLPSKKSADEKSPEVKDQEMLSESDSESTAEPSRPTESPSPTMPDRNEAVRRALLISSDSENDLDNSDSLTLESEPKKKSGSDKEDVGSDKEDVAMEENDGADQIHSETVASGSEVEEDSLKSASPETRKLLSHSVPDPAVESDDSKSTKGSKGEKKKRERKKRRINSDSDFESSDSDKKKRKSKKKRRNASDTEELSDDDDSSTESKSKPKPRRRIKKVAASGSEDSDDSDVKVLNESQRSDPGGSKGRKNIKKIMKDNSLKDETRKAAQEEEDRKRRIADRQKFYNEAFVGDMALINAKTDHLVLDFDPVTKKELVTVDKHLVTKLKPHQVKGVKFMWDACFESLERIKEHPGSGCILAHCMGLGKSLQVVTLAHTVLSHEECQVKNVLVVCPLSTVLNWVNEFKVWLPKDSEIEIYELASKASVKAKDLRAYTLKNWHEGGGVLIIGYDMYRNLTNENNKRIKSKARDIFQRSLVNPGPQLVVCDEGHLLKNESTALSKAMNRIQTKRRIVLTGTPLQNSLLEYHCMIQFVKPNLLGTKKEFTNRFANPIKNGQAADSTDTDVRVMKRRAHVLHKMLQESVQRFDYAVLTPFLPPKHEYVISVKMSDVQIKMYQYYLEHHAKGGPNNILRGKGAGLFADFQALGRVWTHPRALQIADVIRESKAKSASESEGSLADFLDDRADSMSEEDAGVVCLDDSDEALESDNEVDTVKPGWKSRTRAGRGEQPPPEDQLSIAAPTNSSWWSKFVTVDDMNKVEHSGKLVLLMDILRQCELIGDKVLVFSQSLVSLNLIEEFLAAEDEQNEINRTNIASELGKAKVDPTGRWRLSEDYFRLDGQTSAELRKNWCNTFNNPSNLRARLFLISTKAGGLGINLVAANRVIIFDASWNPSHDVQSIFRVYRFGQKKPCYIYRFLAQGTMEEKIYDRQVTKLSLSCRVVDEQQIERHFNSADLNELYRFDPDSHLRRPTPLLPKDRLLAELTIQRKDWIVTYHEHDSLLENKSEEELTESERKAAWDDFENEKRGVNPMMMHDSPGFLSMPGMPGMPDILGGLAGRSVAGIPLSSIASMIYNSNPGITQDEFLGRLRLTVDQLQNFSVQQAAAAAASAAAASAQNNLQQPADAQRLLMQRQVAADQLKRQFGNQQPPGGLPGPSGMVNPVPQPRSRGRPTIGPHQRTDLYGLGSVLSNSTSSSNPPTGQNGPNYPS